MNSMFYMIAVFWISVLKGFSCVSLRSGGGSLISEDVERVFEFVEKGGFSVHDSWWRGSPLSSLTDCSWRLQPPVTSSPLGRRSRQDPLFAEKRNCGEIIRLLKIHLIRGLLLLTPPKKVAMGSLNVVRFSDKVAELARLIDAGRCSRKGGMWLTALSLKGPLGKFPECQPLTAACVTLAENKYL